MTCKQCQEKDKQLKTANDLILSLNEGVKKASLALEILNTKIKEQDTTIMKLHNGIVKVTQINSFKKGLN